MRISLSDLPSPNKEYVIDFPRLDGGLNTWEKDYRLDANESPDLLNLWWQDGALCCRDGQANLCYYSYGKGYSAYGKTFWGHGFFHEGDALVCVPLDDPDAAEGTVQPTLLCEGVPENGGSWFEFGDCLYYKNNGGYYRISFDGEAFSAERVQPYVPIIQINTEPSSGAGDAYQPENRLTTEVEVWYTAVDGVREYRLPTKAIAVNSVTVDGEESTAWSLASDGQTVVFDEANEPPEHDPVVANTVKINYEGQDSEDTDELYYSVMTCPYASTYGGSQNVCVVVGGCEAQPNAYFWSGNNIVMDPSYFPVNQYNFAGATEERITGFGKQQNMLVIFKERSVGRAVMDTVEMASGRVQITMDYTAINSRIGCDLPGTIQLVENNLVFANREQGVHIVADSSAAYENNIVHISRKVDNGLLELIRGAERVVSFDDGDRYWLVADGEAYLWGYTLSAYKDPAWFRFDNIRGVAFVDSGEAKYQLTAGGEVDIYCRSFADYGEAIRKRYRFATQSFGSYDRLKDVKTVIFAVRGDTDTDIAITYLTDYEQREDKTNIRVYSWRLVPRNLAYRSLAVNRFAAVARRRPCCRHVRHFTMALENNEAGQDMSVISAQIYYTFQGRDR